MHFPFTVNDNARDMKLLVNYRMTKTDKVNVVVFPSSVPCTTSYSIINICVVQQSVKG